MLLPLGLIIIPGAHAFKSDSEQVPVDSQAITTYGLSCSTFHLCP